MKSVKKIKWGLLAFVLACGVVFTGCPKATDDTAKSPVIEPNEDGDNDDEDDDAKAIAAGEEITINVGETVKVKAAGKSAAEFTQEGLTITHKGNGIFEITAAADMDDATVSVNFNDGTDTDDGIDVTVNVYDPYYHLTLTLDDAVKAKAATITVSYGGVTKDTVSETVNAVYTAGQATATVKLKKEYADAWKWFSPIKVTVKDSDSNEVVINQSVGYFCYSATEGNDGYLENKTISITAGAEELIFTIYFEGFTAKAVSDVIYTKVGDDFDADGDNADSAKVSVAEGGASATFIVKKSYTNDSGWFQVNFASVVVTDTSDNTVALSSGNTNKWFEYKDGMSTKLTYSAVSTDDYTNALVTAVSLPNTTNGSSVVLLKDELTIPSDAKAFKLVYTKGTDDIVNASSTWISIYSSSEWANETQLVNAWVTGFDAAAETFTVYITESDAVAAFKAGNFYIAADSADYTGTITITYAK